MLVLLLMRWLSGGMARNGRFKKLPCQAKKKIVNLKQCHVWRWKNAPRLVGRTINRNMSRLWSIGMAQNGRCRPLRTRAEIALSRESPAQRARLAWPSAATSATKPLSPSATVGSRHRGGDPLSRLTRSRAPTWPNVSVRGYRRRHSPRCRTSGTGPLSKRPPVWSRHCVTAQTVETESSGGSRRSGSLTHLPFAEALMSAPRGM